ncbi:cell division topological specificity factor MinE [Pseudanabaena sp. PCC 6802]|uniref:cell division topological specificity factor MinE n=1 Tax=Pseudanabaena sp. PCC 6802 TaxID=118173 RepID=UPI000346350E|nr:cell division topological specificity factor MinE [Pseudanabaena sp. PCC 6802]
MITELLERLFAGRAHATSRTKAKQRLKFILAHDRAAISPQMFEQLRREIMQVVSKYVELEEEDIEINLESNRDLTAVIASLPIKAIKRNDEPLPEAPEADFELPDLEPDRDLELNSSDTPKSPPE